jgi:hypothetical protein
MSQLDDLQQGTYGAGGEVMDWTYYDTATLAAGTLSYRMFTIGLGGAAGRTLDITNMTSGGSIPQGQSLQVNRIKLFWCTSAAKATAYVNDFYLALRRTTFEFLIPGKDSLLTTTLQELMGMGSQVALTPTAAGDNIPLNTPRYHGIYPLNIPITLAALTPFEIRITCQTAFAATITGDFLTVGLNGILKRKS